MYYLNFNRTFCGTYWNYFWTFYRSLYRGTSPSKRSSSFFKSSFWIIFRIYFWSHLKNSGWMYYVSRDYLCFYATSVFLIRFLLFSVRHFMNIDFNNTLIEQQERGEVKRKKKKNLIFLIKSCFLIGVMTFIVCFSFAPQAYYF